MILNSEDKTFKHISNLSRIVSVIPTEEEEEDFISALRDRSHIDETLRLATDEKAADYAGKNQRSSK